MIKFDDNYVNCLYLLCGEECCVTIRNRKYLSSELKINTRCNTKNMILHPKAIIIPANSVFIIVCIANNDGHENFHVFTCSRSHFIHILQLDNYATINGLVGHLFISTAK